MDIGFSPGWASRDARGDSMRGPVHGRGATIEGPYRFGSRAV
jgi:hypothetical protein